MDRNIQFTKKSVRVITAYLLHAALGKRKKKEKKKEKRSALLFPLFPVKSKFGTRINAYKPSLSAGRTSGKLRALK